MNRRTCLALLASASVAGAAGCLTGSVDRNRADSPTDRATRTNAHEPFDFTTPPPGGCEAVDPPTPEPSEGLPEPKSYPDRPDSLTEESVRSVFEAYEVAYRYNERLAWVAEGDHCLDDLSVFVQESQVEPRGDGFVGEVTAGGHMSGGHCPGTTGTDTPSPLPNAHFGSKTARYALTDRFLAREGVVVECWT